jgi:lactoylglutathione lyase
MRINHLNLAVDDVPIAAQFFIEYFGFTSLEEKGRDALAVLADDVGFTLIVSHFDRTTKPEYPRDFHIGFIQESKAEVEALYGRLHAAGYVEKPPQPFHGNWGFYFHAPGGILVEVSCPVEK